MLSIFDIKRVKDEFGQKLLNIPGVTGLAIAAKVTDNKKLNELAIIVYVEKKRKPGDIPGNQLIPKQINGVNTDVIERPILRGVHQSGSGSQPDTLQYPKLCGGINIGGGPVAGPRELGTLSTIAYDRSDPPIFKAIVSRHVAAPRVAWNPGDPLFRPGDSYNIVAQLEAVALYTRDTVLPIDAALAHIIDQNNILCQIAELGEVRGIIKNDQLLKMFDDANTTGNTIHVKKRGITSGVTTGTIVAVDSGYEIGYPNDIGHVQFPDSMIEINADSEFFSLAGDSGASILIESNNVEESNRIIGLIVGGIRDDPRITMACHIEPICQTFGVSICET
jgi:hypothetical protein